MFLHRDMVVFFKQYNDVAVEANCLHISVNHF
jgi:hypothetical protein